MACSVSNKLKAVKEVIYKKEKISSVARKYGVSRQILYLWILKYRKDPKRGYSLLKNTYKVGAQHYKYLRGSIEKTALDLVVGNPEFSLRRLTKAVQERGFGVSTHAVYDVLVANDLQKKELREKYSLEHPAKTLNAFKITPNFRVKVCEEYLKEGKPISKICKFWGISRPTFYNWLARYKKAQKEADLVSALAPKYKRGYESHKSVGKGIKQKVLETISQNPSLSVHKIYALLRDEGIRAGHHAIQNLLKREALNTYERRLAYAQSHGALDEHVSVAPLYVPELPLFRLRQILSPFAAIPKLVRANPISGTLLSLLIISPALTLVLILKIALTTPYASPVGLLFAFISLTFGIFFFIYSMKYYMTILMVLKLAQGNVGHLGVSAQKHQGKFGMLSRLLSKAANRLTGGSLASRVNPLLVNLEKVELAATPFVSVHIALYNERRVVERLITAATSQEYGNYEVVIADDSTDETTTLAFETLRNNKYNVAVQERTDAHEIYVATPPAGSSLPAVKIIHRFNRSGFKGAALQGALEQTSAKAEYITIFDADFVPFADTLAQFVKSFQELAGGLEKVASTKIAAVQGYQWHVLNKSQTWVTRGVRTEYAGSYVIERAGEEIYQGLKQISGSVYTIRADILRQFGWGTSITEDYELTLRLYEAGYKVAFTPYIQAPAEAVSTVKTLLRQRMRWAEGASFNTKVMLARMMRSQAMTPAEKLEFVYLAPYYLQAAFFVVGTLSWFMSEAVFGARLPFWTSAFGWSLVFTNLLALPLMNIVGLFLEESDERDYVGILSFVALSYIVVPFQAYAAIKGFLETSEGPWFRTPKSGLVTDTFTKSGFSKFFGGIIDRPAVSISNLKSQISNLELPATRYAFRSLTANHFAIRPRQVRYVGNLALGVAVAITVMMSLFAPLVPIVLPTQASSTKKLASVENKEVYQAKVQDLKPEEITTPQAITYSTENGENLEMIFHKEPRVRFKLGHKEIEITTVEIEGVGKANPQKSLIIGQREVRYEEIVPGIDLVYKLSPKGYEEEFIIKKKVAMRAVRQRVVLQDIKAVGVSGVYGFYDQDGYRISEFSDPFMYEQSNRNEINRKIKYELEKEIVGYSLIKRLEPEAVSWLADPSRAYPVVLDPSLILTSGIVAGDVDFGGNQQKLVQVSSAYYAFHNDGGSIDYQKCTDMTDRCNQDTDWGGNVTMNDGADTDNEGPDVFVDGTTLWVAWFDNNDDNISFQSINTASSDAQGTSVCASGDLGNVALSGVVNISKGSTSGDFVIAYDDDPDVLEVDGVDINCSATETFTDITTNSGITAADVPSIMADGDEVHFVWQEAGTLGVRHNYYDTTDATNAWGTEVAVDTDNLSTSFGFTKASDGDFYVHAVDGTTATDLYRCATPCTAAGRSWASVGAPFSSETNVIYATVTYATTENDLVVSAIMDTSEQAYFRTTDETTISYGCGVVTDCSYGFSAGNLDSIASMKVVTNLADAGVVLADLTGADFVFATVPEKSLFLLVAVPFLPKLFRKIRKAKRL